MQDEWASGEGSDFCVWVPVGARSGRRGRGGTWGFVSLEERCTVPQAGHGGLCPRRSDARLRRRAEKHDASARVRCGCHFGRRRSPAGCFCWEMLSLLALLLLALTMQMMGRDRGGCRRVCAGLGLEGCMAQRHGFRAPVLVRTPSPTWQQPKPFDGPGASRQPHRTGPAAVCSWLLGLQFSPETWLCRRGGLVPVGGGLSWGRAAPSLPRASSPQRAGTAGAAGGATR